MSKKIKFGILGAANIALEYVIPAMQNNNHTEVIAIASRDINRSKAAADKLNIKKAYGSYEELLADPEIDAIYNPLPNHLHIPWSIKALKAGKHVLCEKPIALNAEEAQTLIDASKQHPHLKITEGFMYRFHPQWLKARQLVDDSVIGKLQTIQSFFSYYDDNPKGIHNIKEYGGGSLYDIGCYPISLSRFIFKDEPLRIIGTVERDPKLDVETKTSVILVFNEGTSTFTSSTRIYDHQRVTILGTEGEIEIEIPFNAPNDKPQIIYLKKEGKIEKFEIEICDQYGLQTDAFAKVIIEDKEVEYPIEDALKQMKIIDAIYKSDKEKRWISL